MKRFALLVVIFASLASYQQEVRHAPTVEQCRADQKLWLSRLEDTGVTDPTVNISFKELSGWLHQMARLHTLGEVGRG